MHACTHMRTHTLTHTNSHFQPLFIALAQIWSGFQDEVVLLSVLSNLLNSLAPFTNVCMQEQPYTILPQD